MSTVFNTAPTSLGGGNYSKSFRQFVKALVNSEGQIRVTFAVPSGFDVLVDHVSFTPQGSATRPDTEHTPTEITFDGGAHGFTAVAGSGTKVSDWIDVPYSFSTGDWVCVVFDMNVLGNALFYDLVGSTCNVWVLASGTSYDQATAPGGFLEADGYLNGISKIETQAGAGGGGDDGTTCGVLTLGVG